MSRSLGDEGRRRGAPPPATRRRNPVLAGGALVLLLCAAGNVYRSTRISLGGPDRLEHLSVLPIPSEAGRAGDGAAAGGDGAAPAAERAGAIGGGNAVQAGDAGNAIQAGDAAGGRGARRRVGDFERQPGVVIATKIHGPHQFHLLEQSLCLLHYAYNRRVGYDIVVFTTLPLSDTEMSIIRNVTHPARVSFPLDNLGTLQQEIAALSPVRRAGLLQRCRDGPDAITHIENITWWSNCPDRLAYNWQAEFRGWHLWRHAALRDYRYMLWMDSDGFATKVWPKDPVAYAIRHQTVILFDNMMGSNKPSHPRVLQTFNKTICDVSVRRGRLATNWAHGDKCVRKRIKDIHGFFHITDLDFYRSDEVARWTENNIGDCFCCRQYDDQIAVTVPAALLAPDRSHDMRSNGMRLDVYHNHHLDGKEQAVPAGFVKYYHQVVQHNFSETVGVCRIKAMD